MVGSVRRLQDFLTGKWLDLLAEGLPEKSTVVSEPHKLQREHFVSANLREEKLQDMLFWSNIYGGLPEN
ncbi:hypothetical protein N7539_002422 [Penicillium diatomitis]|uniref:Uncharacterized protein n=1 Tax=Penicillium diatomitis TaxID=2819901 RepID=A0A9X0BYM5_9EURO|nr:uncharacterized protein N7539_002422 [Penicillium diatomitis]KAJ5490855.1 hypothetical protein N7539_002422 [Penicillium diatomitis]